MTVLPSRFLPWPIAWRAVVEIANSENCRLRSYQDIAGVWTIGWGETSGVHKGMQWTQQQADERFCERLTEFKRGVVALLKISPTPHQLGALVSLAYNIGLSAFAGSSVLKAHNRGDFHAAARAFGLWDKARVNGKLQVVRGLTARRAREAALYLEPDPATVPPLDAVVSEAAAKISDMPNAAPESRMLHSPIVQSGAASVAAGSLAMAAEVSGHVQQISSSIGIKPLWIVAVVAIVAGLVALYWRYRQRREGWA